MATVTGSAMVTGLGTETAKGWEMATGWGTAMGWLPVPESLGLMISDCPVSSCAGRRRELLGRGDSAFRSARNCRGGVRKRQHLWPAPSGRDGINWSGPPGLHLLTSSKFVGNSGQRICTFLEGSDTAILQSGCSSVPKVSRPRTGVGAKPCRRRGRWRSIASYAPGTFSTASSIGA